MCFRRIIQMLLLGFVCFLGRAEFAMAHPHHSVAYQADATSDFDGSGSIDFPDFLLFANAFGKSASSGNAKYDLDGNGSVDFGDFLVFASGFGKTVSTGTGTTGGSGSSASQNVTTITIEGSEGVIKSNAFAQWQSCQWWPKRGV